MDHISVPQFLGLLVVMLAAARLCGAIAKAVGQPTVLGELVGGVLLGPSLLGLVNPEVEVVHLLAELGVILLLFAIGLETDLRRLLAVGGTSAAVATAGVVLPSTIISPMPIIAADMWASGARSPEAPTEPWQGTSGVRPLPNMASSRLIVSNRTPDAPWARLASLSAIISRATGTAIGAPAPAECDSTMLRWSVARSAGGM